MNKKEITIYAVQTAMHANETVLIVDGIKRASQILRPILQESIDMNKVIIQRPENTFVIVAERGMSDEKCIEEENLLIIEQALTPRENDIVAYTKRMIKVIWFY